MKRSKQPQRAPDPRAPFLEVAVTISFRPSDRGGAEAEADLDVKGASDLVDRVQADYETGAMHSALAAFVEAVAAAIYGSALPHRS